MTKQHHIFFAFLLLGRAVIANAQYDKDTILTLSHLPMRHGSVHGFTAPVGSIICPMSHLEIYGDDSAVYAVSDGVIDRVTNKQGNHLVLVKKRDTLFVYANLDTVFKATNDHIKKGELLGIAIKEDRFQVIFKIIGKKRELFYNRNIDYLLKIQP